MDENIIKKILKINFIYQFLKFAVIGVLGTGVHMTILFCLTEFLNFYYIYSAIIAFIFANITTFTFNKMWTFKEKFKEHTLSKYTKFLLISLITLSVNLSLLYMFTEYFGIHYLISQILAIALSLWINFIGNKFFTFK